MRYAAGRAGAAPPAGARPGPQLRLRGKKWAVADAACVRGGYHRAAQTTSCLSPCCTSCHGAAAVGARPGPLAWRAHVVAGDPPCAFVGPGAAASQQAARVRAQRHAEGTMPRRCAFRQHRADQCDQGSVTGPRGLLSLPCCLPCCRCCAAALGAATPIAEADSKRSHARCTDLPAPRLPTHLPAARSNWRREALQAAASSLAGNRKSHSIKSSPLAGPQAPLPMAWVAARPLAAPCCIAAGPRTVKVAAAARDAPAGEAGQG